MIHRSPLRPLLTLCLCISLVRCGGNESDDDVPDETLVDADEDGVADWADCDDNDASSTIVALDGDCDGVLTDYDCDDADAASTEIAEDADCDGIVTEDDCDDADAASTVIAEDADCDGVLTAEDCDDTPVSGTALGAMAEDMDCDGTRTTEDCDDEDASSTILAEDADCDGTLTSEDCDDGDAALNMVDVDGDAETTCAGDCDDSNPLVSTAMLELWSNMVDDDCDGNVDFMLEEGDWQLVNSNIVSSSCGVIFSVGEPLFDKAVQVEAKPGGLLLKDREFGNTACSYGDGQFTCERSTFLFNASDLGPFDASYNVFSNSVIVEKSAKSMTATYDLVIQTCVGDDCATLEALGLNIGCDIEVEFDGTKE